MKIVVVITTKDRYEFFSRTAASVAGQSRKADAVIVVSDSEERTFEREAEICDGYGFRLIRDEFSHNTAGSLNTGVHLYLRENLASFPDFDDTYVAVLDDDDTWKGTYLEKCGTAAESGADIVVSGLVYRTDGGEEELPVPHSLTADDFLRGNPHVQGSNTFVCLDTLLRAGLYDEDLPSCTDRDLFVRLMLDRASYAVVDEHLTYVDARSRPDRITCSREKKSEGLRKFYRKYGGLMKPEVERAFFERSWRLFGVGRDEITARAPAPAPARPEEEPPTAPASERPGEGLKPLVVGFTATLQKEGLRLLKQLTDLHRPETKVVVLVNFAKSTKRYEDVLSASGYAFRLVRPSEVREEIVERGLLTPEEAGDGDTVDDICAARIMLQYVLHENSSDGDAVWVLDDDMELLETVREGGKFVTRPSRDIDGVLEEYGDEYDAVIGTYNGDPPLPAFSTLRSSFVDLFYGMTGITRGKPREEDYSGDYYYDFSADGRRHRETPYPLPRRADVYEALSGKATARQLFTSGPGEVSEVRNRGGNTVVFNRELLLIPVRSLRVSGKAGRRGDFVWTVLARRAGYRLAQVPFAVRHSKPYSFFDVGTESDKFLRDVVGAAFSHALDAAGPDAAEGELYEAYSGTFRDRMADFTESFYRASSLSERFREAEVPCALSYYNLGMILKESEPLLERDRFGAALDAFRKSLSVYRGLSETRREREEALLSLGCADARYLGAGSEGAVYTDGRFVYKFFYDDAGLGFFRDAVRRFGGCGQLYPAEMIDLPCGAVVRYPYEESRPYDGGHAEELASLIRHGKANGFLYDNLSRENVVVTADGLKIADYGRAFVPYDEKSYERTVRRAYELIRYPFLLPGEFRTIIRRFYDGRSRALDFGWERLRLLAEGRSKEQIHDGTILALVRGHSPLRALDYGAGKCRIANALAGICSVDAYDIDTDTLLAGAGDGVNAVTDRGELKDGAYDEVTCCLVLCTVDDAEAEDIVEDVARCLRPGGRAVFSVCDPFFDGVARTETRTGGRPGPYRDAAVYEKPMRGGNVRLERHRPVDFYLNLLERSGFVLEGAVETDGVDAETLLPAPEHLVMDCRLSAEPRVMDDLTLLIKVCPGDCDYAYEQIRHIVTTLERGSRFAKRIVTADMAENPARPDRDYVLKRKKLSRELARARGAGLVDEVMYCSRDEGMPAVYEKYFGMRSQDPHSDNGQGLYATLAGFEAAGTRYVFHTDCDIMYLCRDPAAFAVCFADFKASGAVTGTMGIITGKALPAEYGKRTEVRTGFIDLEALRAKLPLRNEPADPSGFLSTLSLPWHRALDERLKKSESVRFHDPALGFVHPGEVAKAAPGLIPACRRALEEGRHDPAQAGQVDLVGNRASWTPGTDAGFVVYVRGRNVPCGRIKRMLDSLLSQTMQDFTLVYIDDASDDGSAEYARFMIDHDERLKGRCVAVFNDERAGELANLVFAMRTLVTNPDAVVVNIDADDCLTEERALERIAAEFDAGADLSCGNCLRTDRPLRHYTVSSFRNLYGRGGDNLWLHPKCFRRSLFDVVDVEEDLKSGGEFFDVYTDFAFMLPMAERAERPVFIDAETYLYDPVRENGERGDEDEEEHRRVVRRELYDRASEREWERKEREEE